MDINSFEPLEYDGMLEPTLHKKCELWASGRWTIKSLYNIFKIGCECGNLEQTLNVLGLLTEDLTKEELNSANRVYLMARAKNLSGVQASLTARAGNAKEAELLLTAIYGVSVEENAVATSSNDMISQLIEKLPS